MHKADIEKLEDILTNQNKYKQFLKLREIELEYSYSEELPEAAEQSDMQDPRTIRTEGGNVSTVERKVEKRSNDLEYQTLYAIVHNTPKFINTLNQYERIIYNYRYSKKDIMIYEWDEIACELDKLANVEDKSIGRTKALRMRDAMLIRLSEYIGYTLM